MTTDSGLQIMPCGERFEELLDFAARLNPQDAHHIGYFGEQREDIRQTLAELEPAPADGFFLAYQGPRLVGVMGMEIDPEIRRAWLFGPLVEAADWRAVADELYATVLPQVPSGFEQELFYDVHNLNCQAFAERQGFHLHSEATVLSLARRDLPPLPPSTCASFESAYFEPLERLHNQTFPNTYYTAQQLVEKQDAHTHLRLTLRGGELLGYIFFNTSPDIGEAYIDFLGVAENCRRQGIGRQLLADALGITFADPAIQRIYLTVNPSNLAAVRLYTTMGFVAERSMRGERKNSA